MCDSHAVTVEPYDALASASSKDSTTRSSDSRWPPEAAQVAESVRGGGNHGCRHHRKTREPTAHHAVRLSGRVDSVFAEDHPLTAANSIAKRVCR